MDAASHDDSTPHTGGTAAEAAPEPATAGTPMTAMVRAIQRAVTAGASAEHKAAGAHACRTILAALEAEAGKPIALPGVPAPSPLASVSPDQALDLVIARLRAAIAERDAQAPATASATERPGLRIAFVQPPPRGTPVGGPRAGARRKP